MRAVTVVALAAALLVASVQVASAAASVSVDPDGGPPATVVTITGEDLPGTTYEVFWDQVGGLSLADGVLNPDDGTFKVQAKIPDDTPGNHRIIACTDYDGQRGCNAEERTNFTISPPATTTTTTMTTTTKPPSTTTTSEPPVTTTTIPSLPIVTTTIPPVPVVPTGDDYTWTQQNPPPPTQPGIYTTATTTPPPSVVSPDGTDPDDWPDLRATAIEITQGMQNIDNDMPLVANRRTYARVYLDVIGEDSWAPISGVLEIWDGAQFIGQLTPENPGATAWADGGDRLDLNDSLYFELPLQWSEGNNVRFSTLVWSFNPSTLELEPSDTNNVRHVFVDFHDAQPVTVHPTPLHLHRSYHSTDEIRTYTAVFGGGVYADEVGATSGALDVIEGLWRFHPVSDVSVEPYPSILYPLEHYAGAEWDLGGCRTVYLGEQLAQVNQPGWDTQPFQSVLDWEVFFKDPGSIDVDDLMFNFAEDPFFDRGLPPDRTGLAIMDRRYEVSAVYIEETTGLVGISRSETAESTGPDPIAGAPAFVGGCSPDDADYGAPNHVMGLARVFYEWDNETEYFLGMVDPSLHTRWGGLASSGSDAAWSKFSQSIGDQPWDHSGARLVGHELGHLTGLKHAPCKDNDGDGIPDELAGGALDLTHPGTDWFPDCRLGEIDPEGFFGFDVYYKMWGLDEPAVISPDPGAPAFNVAYPLMGYLGPKWTDPYHWCRMLEHYGVPCHPNLVGIYWNPPPPSPTDGAFTGTLPPVPAEGRDLAYIIGTLPNPNDEPGLPGVIIYRDINFLPGCHDCWSNISTLGGWSRPPGGGPTGNAPEAPPDHWIEVWDKGELIQRTPLETGLDHEEDHHGPLKFQTIVGFGPESVVRIVGRDGEVLDERPVDGVPIELVALDLRDIDVDSGALDLTGPWEGLPDDALHTLQYSADGHHWLSLAAQRGAPIRDVDPGIFDRLPGSDAGRTRILISAGWSGGVVDGPALEIPNKPPILIVQLPLDGAAYATNELVEMAATALDPEDRNLSDLIHWSSSLDGALGVGSSVGTWSLRPGEHEISAAITDSDGLTTGTTATIFVSVDVVQTLLSEDELAIIARYLMPPEEGSEPTAPIATTDAPEPPDALPEPEDDGDAGGGGGGVPIGVVVVLLLAAAGGGFFLRSRGAFDRSRG